MSGQNIVLIVHYFPPMNSSGAKRMEAMAKYFARAGRRVTVLTSRKTAAHGALTEPTPPGVEVIELDLIGRAHSSAPAVPQADGVHLVSATSGGRSLKALVWKLFGQLPDPRITTALAFASPLLAERAREALRRADVIVASAPPWPILLAGVLASRRFGRKLVLDYRDQFSRAYEMPGSRFAKAVEEWIDRFLIRRGDAVVTVSDPMTDYYGTMAKRVVTIRNGYDPDRIAAARATAPWRARAAGEPMIVRYLGLVTPGRVPHHLLAALQQAVTAGRLATDAIRMEYYGDAEVMREAVRLRYSGLSEMFRFNPSVAYDRALELMVSADYLLMCEAAVAALPGEELSAAGVMTTKLFEYMASGRPIIADISRRTLVGRAMTAASEAHFVADDQGAFEVLLSNADFLHPEPVDVTEAARSYSREGQAAQYLELLDSV